jgi:hypothetical protein
MRVSLTVAKNDTPVTSKRVRLKTSLRSSVYTKRNLDSSAFAKEGNLCVPTVFPIWTALPVPGGEFLLDHVFGRQLLLEP